MARFLSATWFDDVARHSDGEPANVAAGRVAVTPVLTQVVTDTPDGEVRYQIVIEAGSLRVRATGDGGVNGIAAADREGAKEITDPLTFTSDYATASAIARGELSTQAALLEGRLRVSGNATGIAGHIEHFTAIDLLPAVVRATTTY